MGPFLFIKINELVAAETSDDPARSDTSGLWSVLHNLFLLHHVSPLNSYRTTQGKKGSCLIIRNDSDYFFLTCVLCRGPQVWHPGLAPGYDIKDWPRVWHPGFALSNGMPNWRISIWRVTTVFLYQGDKLHNSRLMSSRGGMRRRERRESMY